MFVLPLIIGFYSYFIFVLGVFNLLYKNIIQFSLLAFILFVFYIFRQRFKKVLFKNIKFTKLSFLFISLICIQIVVNLIGVLGPEISFDALWYHLTLPKLYLVNHSIFHIPGGLLYYSDMPKLGEMLYTSGLVFGNEIAAKFIHFSFSLLIIFYIYKFSRKHMPVVFSLMASLIFLSNLVVGWESITSYTDLVRTTFEFLAFISFSNYLDKKNNFWLYLSAVLLGFAITSKLVSVFSLFIYLSLFFYYRNDLRSVLSQILKFFVICLVIPLPWFLFALINTGNPLYPYFSLPVDSGSIFSLPRINDIKTLFLYLTDPINPLYVALVPLLFFSYKTFDRKIKTLILYSLISFLIWFFTQETRGSRFLLPYLPVFSVASSFVIYKAKDNLLKNLLIFTVVIIALISIGYRAFANYKFLPVIFGSQTKEEFMAKNLDFSYGDFYDLDGYFKTNIKSTDRVLTYGFHNLYYVDFNFVDSSWVKSGDRFNYIAVQNVNLPEKYSSWKQVYQNQTTKVKLYSMKGQMWKY